MTGLQSAAIGIGCFVIAFSFASFVEYWMHRLMHFSRKIGERHRDHHRRNEQLPGYLLSQGGFLLPPL